MPATAATADVDAKTHGTPGVGAGVKANTQPRNTVRTTTLLRRLLGVASIVVEHVEFTPEGLFAEVRPSWRKPRCGECGRCAPGYDARPQARRWRAPALGAYRVYLAYAVRRVSCRRCGIRTEQVPWAVHDSMFTERFEELTAYLAQRMDKTTVTKLMGISWPTVGTIVARVVGRQHFIDPFANVRRIGIDEFSYRKRHRYATVVVDHDTQRVLWAGEGRGADTLSQFFEILGNEGVSRLETATIDMSGGYLKALNEHAPHVRIVFDRFHVQRLASAAVDEVRRELWQQLRGTDKARPIKRTRFVLLKRGGDLSRNERARLKIVAKENQRLYRAYLLKETLADALDYKQPKRAERALKAWLSRASRSRLPAFVRVARTIRQHREGILAYIRERLTNGIVEGINNKVRVIARRAYGFHSAAALIAMIYLCAAGVTLCPPLPGRDPPAPIDAPLPTHG